MKVTICTEDLEYHMSGTTPYCFFPALSYYVLLAVDGTLLCCYILIFLTEGISYHVYSE